VAGYYLRFGTLFDFREKLALWFIPLIALSYLAIFHFFDLYRLKKNYFKINSFLTISLAAALAAVFVSFLNYAIFLFPIGRGILVISNLILLILAFVWI
jgi:FlaA1/EpsC-like NDP-sugar epimerase